MDSGWIAVARLVRARGIRGELSAVPLTTHSGRFQDLRQVFLNGHPFEIESVWRHGERWIFKFRGIDSMTEAEKLAGSEVCIAPGERAKLDEGEYYFSDLIGCRVLDDVSGEELGKVESLEEFGGPPILVVPNVMNKEPILIPFAAAICPRIDIARREIRVRLPEGLKGINP